MPAVKNSAVYLHPTAICESDAVGDGTKIWAFAHVMERVSLGRSCTIGDHVVVESGVRIGNRVVIESRSLIREGVTLEDDVCIGPAALFANDPHPRNRHLAQAASRYAHPENWLCPTLVRRGASIGAGAVVVGGVTIGRFASVAAGAVVTQEVRDHWLVAGNPARAVGWVCACGVPLGNELSCPTCARCYEIVDDELVGSGESRPRSGATS